MELGAEFSAPQDPAIVRVSEERRAAKKQRNYWWIEANWPRLKEYLVNIQYPSLRVQCDEACLELGLDPVPKQTIFNVLQKIGRTPITYENALPMKNRVLISENRVNYVEGIIVKIDTENFGMSRKEAIQVISELSQEESFAQAENNLDCLLWSKLMTPLKRLGRVVAAQERTIERSHIFVSQQYFWHIMIEAE